MMCPRSAEQGGVDLSVAVQEIDLDTAWRQITPRDALVDLWCKGTRTISGRVEHALLDLPALDESQIEAWSSKMGADSPLSGEIWRWERLKERWCQLERWWRSRSGLQAME